MRIAFDSAILVRANQSATGLARAVLENGHTMVLSASVLDEVGRVLHYPRLLKAYALTGIEISRFVAFLSASAHVVEIDETVAPPIRDPDDVHIIRTAVSGKADLLCTLDAHFYDSAVLEFCRTHGIRVVWGCRDARFDSCSNARHRNSGRVLTPVSCVK